MGTNQSSRFSARLTHDCLSDGAENPHDLCGRVKRVFTADALHYAVEQRPFDGEMRRPADQQAKPDPPGRRLDR